MCLLVHVRTQELNDLRKAAEIIAGQKVKEGVKAIVVPGSLALKRKQKKKDWIKSL